MVPNWWLSHRDQLLSLPKNFSLIAVCALNNFHHQACLNVKLNIMKTVIWKSYALEHLSSDIVSWTRMQSWGCQTHLANISFSSCSDTNCPRLATNNVEQGALAEIGWLGGWVAPVEPTGLANAGLGKKWPVERFADAPDKCMADGWWVCIWRCCWW